MSIEEDFYNHQAQTTPHPLGLKVKKAKGSYIIDEKGNKHLDFVAGVSAVSVGHGHPAVVSAIRKQSKKYLHVMVYGEYIQSPAVAYCKKLVDLLPQPLDQVYLVNSGTEAIEGALKLARRATGRYELIAAKNAYHGNTMGSLSLMDYETRKGTFRPLLPGVRFLRYNSFEDIELITEKTAAVVLESIQGGAGFITPKLGYLQAVKARCEAKGALLILDEIQPGFGRTGKLFGFMHDNVIPDILVVGKGMAGGLPAGAFVASKALMQLLSHQPKLGHITTFGGNPLIAAASLATLNILISNNLMAEALEKEKIFRTQLVHPKIKELRGRGLMLAMIMDSSQTASDLVIRAAQNQLILFFLLFESKAVRITPPLTISKKEIQKGIRTILRLLNL